MRNFDYCEYTYRHRRAIEYLIDKIFDDGPLKEAMKRRAIAHDVDKLVMYQMMDKEEASRWHTQTARHHMTNGAPKTMYDKLEAILDYESAAYTKPDKPLNAFDTINMLFNKGKMTAEIKDDLIELCRAFGLASSYTVLDDKDGIEALAKYSVVTEEMIREDIARYFEFCATEVE